MSRESGACDGEDEHQRHGRIHASRLQPDGGTVWRVCLIRKNFDRQDFAVDTFNNTLNLLLRIGRWVKRAVVIGSFQSAIVLLRRMIEIFQKLQQEHNMLMRASLLM